MSRTSRTQNLARLPRSYGRTTSVLCLGSRSPLHWRHEVSIGKARETQVGGSSCPWSRRVRVRASLMRPVFVDPSRRAVEFRTDGSDETLRKSQWNRTLVEQLLVPLLREVSTEVIANAPQLIEQEPKRYLSLFPATGSAGGAAACLADVVRASFCDDLWVLKLYDIWKEPFDVWVGLGGSELELEKVPRGSDVTGGVPVIEHRKSTIYRVRRRRCRRRAARKQRRCSG